MRREREHKKCRERQRAHTQQKQQKGEKQTEMVKIHRDLRAMDKKSDLRRTAVSTVNGMPRGRQRATKPRDSMVGDDDRRMELKETVMFRDREHSRKRERGRDFSKRKRVDKSIYSSDEEYLEEDTRIHQQNKTNQLPAAFSSPASDRRDFRAHRSSPMVGTVVDHVIGVPITRRIRSALVKKIPDHRNSGNVGFGDDLNHRKIMPAPATVIPIGSGGATSSSSGASLKKKMKCVEPVTHVLSGASNSKPSSVVQNDIEMEVAEALYDLMIQAHSQSQSSQREDKVDRDSTNTADDELKRLKAAQGKDEDDALKVQNEQSIKVNAETILAEKEKFTDEPAQELESVEGFVDIEKVGSPKETESSSLIKVDACDGQDPTMTKADDVDSVVEARKETRIEIDLTALPSLPSSPEKGALHDIDPEVTTPDVQKKSVNLGVTCDNQLLNLNLIKETKIRKEPKNKSPTPIVSLPIGMGTWPIIVPHPGLISHPAVLPIEGNAGSSMIVQTPQFQFTQPRTKRSTTHRCIVDNINHHQQLLTKSLSSGPTPSTVTLYGTKPWSLKSMLQTQKLIPGRDKSSDVAAADINATTSGKPVLQQTLNQALTHNNFSQHNHGFTFPLGHHQTTMMEPGNSLVRLPPQSASSIGNTSLPSNNPSRKLAPNSSLPDASSSSFTHHPFFPSNEAAASYMSMLQNAGCPFPIPKNMFSNSSFYSPPAFNTFQKSASHNKLSSPLPEDNSASNNNDYSGQAYSFPAQPLKSGTVAATNNKRHGDLSQQGSKNRAAELVPRPFPLSQNPSSIFQMLPEYSWNGNNNTNKNFPTSEGKKSHAASGSKFDSSAQALTFLPSSSLSSIAMPNFYHQMQLIGGSGVQTDCSSFLPKWESNNNINNNSNFPRNTSAPEGSSSQSLVNIPQLKTNNHPAVGNNNPALVVGSSSDSRNTSSGQKNASTVLVLASQETEGSQNGPGQKASPTCRRALPSIVSTCASQLSEIKYG